VAEVEFNGIVCPFFSPGSSVLCSRERGQLLRNDGNSSRLSKVASLNPEDRSKVLSFDFRTAAGSSGVQLIQILNVVEQKL
jgi:hypothetical protein